MGSGGGFFEDLTGGIVEGALNTVTLGAYGGQRAARAQGDIAEAQLAQQREDRALALKFAEATPEELAQLNKTIQVNEADIARKTKLLESADPAIMEAGKQALGLLRGEEAKILSPLRNQFSKQESELRAKLTAQLGPGYETSTAGIQALQALKQSQNDQLTTAQQGTLGQLLGVAQGVSGAGYGNSIAMSGNLGQVLGDIQKRKVSALTGAPITGAGAQFVGDLQSARAGQQTFKNILEVGSTVFGAMSGQAPSGTPGQIQSASNSNPYSLEA
jgi:hypothetical protein